MPYIMIVGGTRPEGVKLAPVALEARSLGSDYKVRWVSTGQHREMMQQALAGFGIRPDVELDVFSQGQSLNRLQGRVFESFDGLLASEQPDLVVVQGDTSTAFACALAAFGRKIPLAHVEAGLRSFNPMQPYPEEANRRMIAPLASLHFAPTQRSAENLLKEGIDPEQVFVTGNTVVDAIELMRSRLEIPPASVELPAQGRLILVTAHRRESWDNGLLHICRAVRQLRDQFEDIHFLFPVHLNPIVRRPIEQELGGQERVILSGPLEYLDLQRVLTRAYLVLTDSGGIQEEAPSFGKPVLVLRQLTERPEAVEAGSARIVGTDVGTIVDNAAELLGGRDTYERMSAIPNPFGDGQASRRIVRAMVRFLEAKQPILEADDRFAPTPDLGSLQLAAE
jgi:UDP-N-acetylglucosamine 2-epimerase (non-hydrolysing)